MVIKIIKDADLGTGLKNKKLNNPSTRFASRGIIVRADGKIGLFHKANKNEYKLPGGGIENEKPKEAFLREIMEETGCEVEITKFLGTIEEHKTANNFKQVSYVFVAKLLNDTHTLHLTEKEKLEGAEFMWATVDESLELIKNSFNNLKASNSNVNLTEQESVYMTQFVIKRDEAILNYYKNLLGNNKI